jgi:hypothetical protein
MPAATFTSITHDNDGDQFLFPVYRNIAEGGSTGAVANYVSKRFSPHKNNL